MFHLSLAASLLNYSEGNPTITLLIFEVNAVSELVESRLIGREKPVNHSSLAELTASISNLRILSLCTITLIVRNN